MEPVTGYARLGDQRIYYQTIGEGPPDLIINTGAWGSIDIEWEDPEIRLFFQKTALFGRTIRFDRRGSGASDPIPLGSLPPWESFMDELECVMDHVGSKRATVLGIADGGPASMLLAANRPDLVDSLVPYCTYARLVSDDAYPYGVPQEGVDTFVRDAGNAWGTPESAAMWLPSKADDPSFLDWQAKVQRAVSSPSAWEAYTRQSMEHDVRSILPAIRVPTLVMHVKNNPLMPIDFGRYIADHIEGARMIELEGADVAPYWEQPDEILAILGEFVTGTKPEPVMNRRLATVMFTDIVDSTRKAEKMGDGPWRALLDVHDETTRRLVSRNGGKVVKTTGDGVLATFDGPGRAIRCAGALGEELSKVNISLRTGIHAGEIEMRGADVGGLAVHLASRVMSAASPGEILVSRTVRELVVGSGIAFADRGPHRLKGIEGDWQLYSVQ
jgi:class 3 adenylate cyclase/esterase/lipase